MAELIWANPTDSKDGKAMAPRVPLINDLLFTKYYINS
jgi:hypothetical protein